VVPEGSSYEADEMDPLDVLIGLAIVAVVVGWLGAARRRD
jgi:hypothetical protein